MQVMIGDFETNILKIVENKAKYQKVMLIYDDSINNVYLDDFLRSFRNICIVNAMNINCIDEGELYNGYRLIIWLCEVDSFLTNNVKRNEFVNIYCCTSNTSLPYFINENNLFEKTNDFLLIRQESVDLNLLSSLYFNNFCNYFIRLVTAQQTKYNNTFFRKEITAKDLLLEMDKTQNNLKFYDIEILKSEKICVENLQLVELVIVDAILIFLNAMKNKELELVDFYKEIKHDERLIDKCYAYINNDILKNLINLNFFCIYNTCQETKTRILEVLQVSNAFKLDNVNSLVNKIKNYCKHCNELFCLLYIYNVFPWLNRIL